MKIGDLVEITLAGVTGLGLIVETGKYTGNKDVKVKFFAPSAATPMTFRSENLRVISAA